MSNSDFRQGLYSLSTKEIYAEAKGVFQDFFINQTPLNAFKLSITLYHLKEWIEESEGSNNAAKRLVHELENYEFYEVLRSIANTSKHFHLRRSTPYDQIVTEGFMAGKSVAGERVGQANLAVDFKSKEVWLREVFAYVLKKYADYFEDSESIYPVEN
ncbi:MAG: hypothetical protein KME13_25045 [Myxacorys californica WJT36-NPBG1]|jgi:hypothetical protein|nr:hypothetical protein [Myxacorys californica WJT36-NPBG1]